MKRREETEGGNGWRKERDEREGGKGGGQGGTKWMEEGEVLVAICRRKSSVRMELEVKQIVIVRMTFCLSRFR